jgi:broad specificity polyphosphatase/5'/3'-nucleotidase SurE
MRLQVGWETRVVIPSSQKSWIGKAFHIKEVVKGVYYYPCSPGELVSFGTSEGPTSHYRWQRVNF